MTVSSFVTSEDSGDHQDAAIPFCDHAHIQTLQKNIALRAAILTSLIGKSKAGNHRAQQPSWRALLYLRDARHKMQLTSVMQGWHRASFALLQWKTLKTSI
jgi:hypothetical protein